MSYLGVQVDQADGEAAGSALKKDVLLSLGLAWVGGCHGPVLPQHTGRLRARSVPHREWLCRQEDLQREDTAKPKQRQPRHDFL